MRAWFGLGRERCALIWGVGLFVAGTAAAVAHPLSHSLSRLVVSGTEVTVALSLDLLELTGVDRNRDGLVVYDELDAEVERISIVRPDAVQEALLDAQQPSVSFQIAGRSRLPSIWRFVRLGVEHIFTGYDHLAFLVCVLLGAATVRSIALVVTSFTVAHSITLALATFEVLVLPSKFIESLIALSIAYVAIENFLGRQVVVRYKVTFFFGLVHGFGFSNILREMELPRTNLAVALFSFNAGVEIGQVLFVSILFPVVAYLSGPRGALFRASISLALFWLSVFWFVERVLPTR